MDILLEYEGNYEYVGENTLDIIASELDTTLYAIVDEAKYPLKYIGKDTFANIQNVPVIFERNDSGSIASYKVNDQTFKIITTDIERMEMNPRKELLNNPDKYDYQQPQQLGDGLEVGTLEGVFNNPEPILQMVKNTISGEYPEVHSILILKNNKLVL
ncbi:MAG: 6-aminohexanoate hydrolase, partial [Bacteroidota bacterium]